MKLVTFRKLVFGVFLLIIMPSISTAQTIVNYDAVRLNGGNPIIDQDLFADAGVADEGENINGPSLIRIPDWIPTRDRADPSAVYYLYFGDHVGDYIRMAWASSLVGPWNLYQSGSRVSVGDRGVLDNGGRDMNLGRGIVIEENHLASPDVHVDDENQRIIMYFHSGSSTTFNGRDSLGQVTWVSTSSDGLEFRDNIEPVALGSSYFRVFETGGEIYAFDNSGIPRRALDPDNPWEPTSNYYSGNTIGTLWERHPRRDIFGEAIERATGLERSDLRVRHTAVRLVDNQIHVFYSQRGVDAPERIMLSTIDLDVNSWADWEMSYPPNTILTAADGWEGGQFNPEPSELGGVDGNVNQLRDPYVFEDADGLLYLVYAGRGESGLGITSLTRARDGSGSHSVDGGGSGGGTTTTGAGPFPDASREYFIDSPRFDLRLAANAGSSKPYTRSSGNNTGVNVRWRFISNGEGLWHVQRSDGGDLPRLRSDSTSTADLQGSSSDGTRTAFAFEAAGDADTYFFTLTGARGDDRDFSRLQIDRDGNVNMVPSSFAGSWERFRVTDAGAR